jgi:hypothetical protein
LKPSSVALEPAFDGRAEVRLTREAAGRHLVVLDLLEHRLDAVELRAVRGQVVQENASFAKPGRAALTALLVWMPALSSTTTRGTSAAGSRPRRYASRSSDVSARSNGTASRRGAGASGS